MTEVNILSGSGYIAVELWNDWTMSSIKGGKILKWRFASEKLIMKKKRGATAIAGWNSAANRRRIKTFLLLLLLFFHSMDGSNVAIQIII